MSQETKDSLSLKKLIEKRAFYKKKVRYLLDCWDLLEVDVPALGIEACPDPSSLPLEITHQEKKYFLQPSPEYFIKRLLAKTPGSYYSLAPCYRNDPITPFHNKEFLMLEYYILGKSYEKIQSLTQEIIKIFYPAALFKSLSYHEVFIQYLNFDISVAPLSSYHELLDKHCIDYKAHWNKQELEDLIFGTLCQKHLGHNEVIFVDKFPYEHRALSYFDPDENFSYRFEVFIKGVEIANGYKECTNLKDNERRIASWETLWKHSTNSPPPTSKKFLESIKDLPECSGVAFGFDRMIMLSQQQKNLDKSILFPWNTL